MRVTLVATRVGTRYRAAAVGYGLQQVPSVGQAAGARAGAGALTEQRAPFRSVGAPQEGVAVAPHDDVQVGHGGCHLEVGQVACSGGGGIG